MVCLFKRWMLVILFLLAATGAGLAYDFLCLECHFAEHKERYPAAILVCMGTGDTGMERSALLHQQAFIDAGIDSVLVCHRNSYIARTAMERKLPVVICSNVGICSKKFAWLPGVQRAIRTLAKRFGNRLLAVHCNMPREAFAAKRAVKNSRVPVIFTQHTPNMVSTALRQTVDGFIGMSRMVADQFAQLNKKEGIACPVLDLPPYLDLGRFLNVSLVAHPELVERASSDRTRKSEYCKERTAFFKQHFGLELKPVPLLLKVANFYSDIQHKNHPLMLRALHELVHNRGIPVQLALAGSGKQDAMRALVHELNLEEYVYFLGATDRVPELLAYADVCVLASSKEAGATVIIEGGVMGKPIIVSRGTGPADWLITDRQTGYLFENGNVKSLADTIEFVVAHPAEAQACGERLQERVMTQFLPAQTVAKTVAFYREVAKR